MEIPAEANASPPRDIGELLLENGVVTREELERARRVHARLEVKSRLTEVLVRLGYTAESQIRDTMKKYKRDLRLGDFLIEMRFITEVQLEKALKRQQQEKKRLGTVLVESGVLSEVNLCRALAERLDCPIIEPDLRILDKALLKQTSVKFLRMHNMLPFSRSSDGVVVIFSDPLDQNSLSAANQLFGPGILPAITTQTDLIKALDGLDGGESLTESATRVETDSNDIIGIVDYIIQSAIDNDVSDIHIEPMARKIRVRYRKDGVLIPKTEFPKGIQDHLLSRIKIMAGADIADKRHHQDAKIDYVYYNDRYDIRLSSYVTLFGENIVLRILSQKTGLKSLQELGMAPKMLSRYIQDVLEPTTGVVIMTGPTGSGKTTTLYSSIAHCNEISVKIITAEDPVEYVIDGIIQCSINEQIGRTYEDTLRAIVRQDPDIIVLGEIRDRMSAEVAITAALTGHKVFSTFHTEDSIGGIIRLIDMDIETFLISSTVLSILAQRLLRRICPFCKESYKPNPLDLSRVGFNVEEVRHHEFYRGSGCEHCHYTGYKGRIGIYELLVMNEQVRNAVLEKATSYQIRAVTLAETGLATLLEDALLKVLKGVTTLEEVRRQVPYTARPRSIEVIQSLTE